MWKQETATEQMSQAVYSSLPLSLCTVTPICWGLEHHSGGGDHDFHLHPEQQRVGEEKGWCTWCSSGGQMNQMKLQPSCSCAHTSTKGQSQSLLQLVACLEDRWGYGAGPGGPRLPAGTSRLGWYIRSRSQLTCHSREHWDEVERLQRFCVLQMWSSYHESLQRMNKTCQAMYSKTSNWPT